jgi:hypothetical protein
MLKARGDRGCCDRCAGATGAADAARIARRRLLKDAVFRPQGGHGADPPSGWLARAEAPARGGFPDLTRLPRAVTGTVLDVSPHVLVLGEPGGRAGAERS